MKNSSVLVLSVAAAVSVAGSALVLNLRAPKHAHAASPLQQSPTAAPPAPAAVQPSPTPKPADKVPVNEVGRIPVLMYHSVGDPVPYDRHGLNITPALFRKHLQMLHDNGFYPMNMRDILTARIDVPRGKTPVVITFDDARGSQFRYRKDGSIDPNCAVGILDSFHNKYGGAWPQRASFYVLPASKYNPVPFWQAKQDAKKFQYLVSAGYEVANHSTSHHAMSGMDASRLAWEMKTCQEYVKARAPQATMDTVAVPYGIYPKSAALTDVLVKSGNKCVLMAWGDASYAPTDKRYDPKHVMRIGSEPGNIERWIQALVRDRKSATKSLRPYVSDGDPNTVTVPSTQVKYLNKSVLSGVQTVVYNEPVPASPAKAKTAGKGTKKMTKPGAGKAVKTVAKG